ncbi:hypothetical protein, partial [Corynebacterium urealyticum]|uniref:hypothetical protein n=1 Tax=Corynebacterium urealyticum TaxID=43771 RepID=UPI001CA37236
MNNTHVSTTPHHQERWRVRADCIIMFQVMYKKSNKSQPHKNCVSEPLICLVHHAIEFSNNICTQQSTT